MTVRISNLVCKLGERVVLDQFDLDLHERRIGIIGRNGSGKSTLGKCLAGLLEPVSGQVSINRIDVVKDRKAAISTVGILFQNPDHQIIFPTPREEIAFGARQLGLTKSEADRAALDLLETFQRTDWADRPISHLSQGQRHLVCLLAVLVMKPSVIILDEPFSGLDIPTMRKLQNYFEGLEQTLFHITHAPATIQNYDRVLWIEDGRVLRDGVPSEVLPEYLAAMEDENARTDL